MPSTGRGGGGSFGHLVAGAISQWDAARAIASDGSLVTTRRGRCLMPEWHSTMVFTIVSALSLVAVWVSVYNGHVLVGILAARSGQREAASRLRARVRVSPLKVSQLSTIELATSKIEIELKGAPQGGAFRGRYPPRLPPPRPTHSRAGGSETDGWEGSQPRPNQRILDADYRNAPGTATEAGGQPLRNSASAGLVACAQPSPRRRGGGGTAIASGDDGAAPPADAAGAAVDGRGRTRATAQTSGT